MSLMKSVIETVARFAPDPKHDPLLDHPGLVGQSFHRVDGEMKVSGNAPFTAEYDVPDLAHAVLVCSTIAKGRVRRIDTARALAAPGVLEVLTHKNMPRLTSPPLFDVGNLKKGMAPSDLPILQKADIDWDGQPVAVVIAETLEQAEHAANLVEVEYDTDPGSTSLDALKSEAFPPKDVLGEPPVVEVGEGAAALKSADVRIEPVYRTPRYNHNAIEPHASIAWWTEDGSLVIFDSTQSVNTTARTLSTIFGLDFEKIQVLAPFVGGGFGGKGGLWNHSPLCAAAAKVLKRPVKLSLTREHVYRVVGGRTPAEQKIALGATRDGKLTTIVHEGLTATTSHGRYAEQCTFPARHLYAAPNLYISQKVVYLDTVANTWMRAPGESIGTFALESALDELAEKLGIDPIELRRLNEPSVDPTKGTPFSLRLLTDAYRLGADKFGWSRRNPEPRATRDGHWLVGQGVATAYYPYLRFPTQVRLRLSADGRVTIQSPAAEMGMGTATAQIQHAADRLGVPLDCVTFEYGNSQLADTPLMAGGSTQTATVFAGVQAAALALQKEIAKLTAKHGGEGESYASILQRAGRDHLEVTADSGPPVEMMKYSMASYGAQFCEVRVHEITGEIRVSRWLSVIDCGKVVNPKTAVSQMRGGVIMGIGMALMEETMLDERRGRIMNPSLAEYHVPVNLDVPDIDVHFLDVPDERAPLGVRGIGEIGITGVAAAIANAIYNATGRRLRQLPITLDQLF